MAKITQPANTAAITNAMITDLRTVANPRILPVNRVNALVAPETETLTVTADIGEWFPNAGGGQYIDIPSWATRAIVDAYWIQVREPGGNAHGQVWVEYGPKAATGLRERSTQRFQWNTNSSSDVSRAVWMVSDDVYIPAAYRGTNQLFQMKGRVFGASSGSARPQVDGESGVKMQVTFLEVADPSDT